MDHVSYPASSSASMLSSAVASKFRLAVILLLALTLASCCAAVSTQHVTGPCPDNLASPIPNFCVVTPDRLWRGARPDSDGASWLIQAGVRTLVNLEVFLDDRSAFAHATVPAGPRIEVGYFRVSDWEPLTLLAPSIEDDHVAHLLALLSQQPTPVYVHCRCGTKRTAVMVAAYRVLVENVSVEQAIREMRAYRGPWFPADAKYIRSLSQRRDEMRQKVAAWVPRLKADGVIVCADRACAVVDR